MPLTDVLTDGYSRSPHYSEEYEEKAFIIWYRANKPNALRLYNMLPPDETGRKISRERLRGWIQKFRERAVLLDDAVKNELSDRMVKEKIEMLNRHAEIAVELQDRALDYLRKVEDNDLGASSAVRMLVEAIRIERISRGVPQVLEKMATMSDDDLLKEAEKLLLRSPITEIAPIEGAEDYDDEETDELSDL